MKVKIPKDAIIGPFKRRMGDLKSQELLGGGFLHKPWSGIDHQDFNPEIYSLNYLIQGRGSYTDYRGTVHPLEAGCLFQRIPGYPHTTRISEKETWWECFIDLGPRLTEGLIAMRIIDPESPVGSPGLSQAWVEEYNTLHHLLHQAPPSSLRGVLPRMLDLHHRLLRATEPEAGSTSMKRVNEACRILESNFSHGIALRALCAERGWGYESFRKNFQSAVGLSPGQYRLRCRMSEASRLLKGSPDLPIARIARQLGYANPYEFTAQFKRYTGLSPRTFRQVG